MIRSILIVFICAGLVESNQAQTLTNWETPHVHPLAITLDGTKLLAVNTPDNKLEVYDINAGQMIHLGSVAVGLDPVSVRARTNSEAWVINHISDSISIIDLEAMNVVATLPTDDEPTDVVFAGQPSRAFVSCSQVNAVLVFDLMAPGSAPIKVNIDGQDPRAMAVSSDGLEVYVAVFESGNGTTILGGGATMGIAFPPNAVNDPVGPYGGINPPPNDGASFRPPMKPGNPPPPPVGLIVQKNSVDQWMDDNGGDWTSLVSGAQADKSGRSVGWDLPDNDLAIIDAASLSVSYATRAMNICMALAVHPVSGQVTMVGIDSTNAVRYEPVLSGRFIRVNLATIDPSGPSTTDIHDLNSHLTYTDLVPFVPDPQSVRDMSIGDPRAIVWNSAGTRGYVAGMGSNNLVVIDAAGNRLSPSTPTVTDTIEVGEGPTGLAMNESQGRLFVMNKFAASISVVDLASEAVANEVSFFDPSPSAIKQGRKHLYDAHKTSGLGHISCASCHIDGRMDQLAWDLGAPDGDMKTFNQNCPDGGCQDWHPMKGPMTTQTLQDIIGKEPLHWRGDREGLEAFNGAFLSLLGDDVPLTSTEMQEFEDFLATIFFPPNPFREFDNGLPTDLPLVGHFSSGMFTPLGTPLPNGNAQAGLDNYRLGFLDGVQCVTCHTLPVGIGPDGTFVAPNFVPLAPGPNGERHHASVSVDGSTNVSIKIPQMRNLYEKVGFETTQTSNTSGFGFIHDGSVDSIARFVTEPVFSLGSEQEVSDMVAFMLAFSGSDLPVGSPTNPLELPGPSGNDTHAAVGVQVTLDGPADPVEADLIAGMIALAEGGSVGLVAKGQTSGENRGYAYTSGNRFQSDRTTELLSDAALLGLADVGSELTFTVVPANSEVRIGIDRDEDGFLDGDELDACSNPGDANNIPGDNVVGDGDWDGDIDLVDYMAFTTCFDAPGTTATRHECGCNFDFDADADIDLKDYWAFQVALGG